MNNNFFWSGKIFLD